MPAAETPRFRRLVAAALVAAAIPAGVAAQRGPSAPAGPLFIVGGGSQPDALVTRFIDMAGGPGTAAGIKLHILPPGSTYDPRSGTVTIATRAP